MQIEMQRKPYVQWRASCVQRAFVSLSVIIRPLPFAKKSTNLPDSAPICKHCTNLPDSAPHSHHMRQQAVALLLNVYNPADHIQGKGRAFDHECTHTCYQR